MAYDATKLKEWQIAELAEANMPTPDEWREKLNLKKDEVIPYGRIAKLDFLKIMDRLKKQTGWQIYRSNRYYSYSAGRREKHHLSGSDGRSGQTRQKRRRLFAPAFRRSDHEYQRHAAGGGNALLIPMTEFSMGLTGDINDIMNAHNLAMVALDLQDAARTQLYR